MKDTRVRETIFPSKIVKVFGKVQNAEALLQEKPLQITTYEPLFATLTNDGEERAGVLLDFGKELHGSLRVLTHKSIGATSENVRITLGESVAEALSDNSTLESVLDAARRGAVIAEKKGYGDDFALLEAIERITPGLFNDFKGTNKPMCANVDLYSGLVYRMLGIPVEMYTPLFAIARVAGWCAHRMEEFCTAKKIIRPAYKCIEKPSVYVPLEER